MGRPRFGIVSGFRSWVRGWALVLAALLAVLGLLCAPGGADPLPDSYEADNTAGSAHSLSSTSAQSHTIHTPDDVDWVYFRISQVSRVVLKTDGFSEQAVMTLYGPNSSTREVDDNAEPATKIEIALLPPGQYYVHITARSDHTIDSYSVRLTVADARDEYEPDNTSSQASRLTPGAAQKRSFHAPDDVDWARFTVTTRQDVEVATNGSSGDTVMVLFGPDSPTREIARDDDSGNGLFAKITRRGLGAGAYYVRIIERGQDNTLPAYTLRLTTEPSGDAFESDDAPENAKQIAVNSSQSRSLDVAADLDWVRFRLTRQSAVVIETSGAGGDTELFLYASNPGGQELAYDDDGGPEAFSRIEQPLIPPGDYFLRVQAREGTFAIPTYTLRVDAEAVGDLFEPDNTEATESVIAAGETQSRSLDPAGDVDWVRFTLVRTSYVTLGTHESAGDTEVALFAEGSSVPLVAVGGSTIAQPSLPVGSYLIRVRSPQGARVSGYLLSLLVSDAFEPDDTPETARLLALGETQERSLHRPGDVDWVRFLLTTESPMTVKTDIAAGGAELAVFAEGQTELPPAEKDPGSGDFVGLRFEVLPPGPYLIRVRMPGELDTVGRYHLTLSNADAYEPDDTPATAAEIGVGDTQHRSLPVRTDVDWVRFTLIVPTKVVIETAGPAGNTELLLFAAGRTRKLASDNNGGVGSFSRIVKKLKPGSYLIQVRTFRAREAVPRYTLRLTPSVR